ncbi:MAG: hypothetical protein D6689_12350 [Deltaproteobacteria bacterium]|nr:MAG: hypothetical protein D6689_12350 [Deltaproteobacteria bacterium]
MGRGQTIKRQQFLPYRYDRFGVVATPERCAIDGARTVTAVRADRHLVDLSAHRFDEATIEWRLDVPAALIDAVLPPGERADPPVAIVVAVRCPATRLRTAVRIPWADVRDGKARAATRIRRGDARGSVDVVALAVRTRDASDAVDGYAMARGARLAGSRPWELRFDRLRDPRGAYLDVRYARFGDYGPPQFPSPASLYQLDCDGDSPVLWLNLDHERVCEALDSNANVGTRAAIRDVLFDSIAHAVWTRLFVEAAEQVRDGDEPPFEWQRSVLERFLPALYPHCTDHAARVAALREEREQGDAGRVLDRLDAVLQEQLDVAVHAARLIERAE